MKYLFKIKKGDISLLVTLMVCSIMLIYLAPISQKLSVESKISRENLMSQQAIQAAKTGLEHWVYDIEERATSNVINFNFSGNDKNVPQNLTSWESLDSNLGIEYRVDFFPKNGSNPAYIVSRGRVNSNGFTVERTFEEKFQTIATPAYWMGYTQFNSGAGRQVFSIWSGNLGNTCSATSFINQFQEIHGDRCDSQVGQLAIYRFQIYPGPGCLANQGQYMQNHYVCTSAPNGKAPTCLPCDVPKGTSRFGITCGPYQCATIEAK